MDEPVKDISYWLNIRKISERNLLSLALKTKRRSKAFDKKLETISKVLEMCTREINKLEDEKDKARA